MNTFVVMLNNIGIFISLICEILITALTKNEKRRSSVHEIEIARERARVSEEGANISLKSLFLIEISTGIIV